MAYSPIVGILGHRQVGKTTLLESLATHYVSLDRRSVLDQIEADPDFYVRSFEHRPVALDESQLSPPLFPALKELVRTDKRPGQFLLSGSVRFTSRRAIRESLTGRIVNFELIPFSVSELEQEDLPDTLIRILQGDLRAWARDAGRQKASIRLRRAKQLSSYTRTGGLPGICFLRDAGIRGERLDTQLDTILDRDLRLLLETSLRLGSLRALLALLATLQGQPLEWAELARRSRISAPTLRKLIPAFESLFLIRVLHTEGTEKKPTLFFEDQAEAYHRCAPNRDPDRESLGTLFANVRSQFHYRPELQADFFQYRNHGGALVPLAIRSQAGTIGLITSRMETPTRSHLLSAQSFLKSYPKSKVLIVHPLNRIEAISPNIAIAPLASLT